MSDEIGDSDDSTESSSINVIEEISSEIKIVPVAERTQLVSAIISIIVFLGPILTIIILIVNDWLPKLFESISYSFTGIFLLATIFRAYKLSRT